jgi:hypothetical protein
MSAQHTPGKSFDDVGRRLISLQKLARLEKKEFGGISERTTRCIRDAIAEGQAVIIVDDILSKAAGSQS